MLARNSWKISSYFSIINKHTDPFISRRIFIPKKRKKKKDKRSPSWYNPNNNSNDPLRQNNEPFHKFIPFDLVLRAFNNSLSNLHTYIVSRISASEIVSRRIIRKRGETYLRKRETILNPSYVSTLSRYVQSSSLPFLPRRNKTKTYNLRLFIKRTKWHISLKLSSIPFDPLARANPAFPAAKGTQKDVGRGERNETEECWDETRVERDGEVEEGRRRRWEGDTGIVIRAQERNASAVGHSPVTEGATPPIKACQPRDAQSRLALLRRKPEIVRRSPALAGKSASSIFPPHLTPQIRSILNRVKIAREFIRKDTYIY